MILTFKTEVPLKDTMILENLFEKELRMKKKKACAITSANFSFVTLLNQVHLKDDETLHYEFDRSS